ncbi:MAG: YjbQ family protein [Candidatus Marinimicrobia bacterium]|nr:YjbQ family protein [Candidatus Neomarinimicrobiota bacterium]MBL7059611.1 YjbQ family protein [Candidatus Neomarinimicrobiota bacterium]
MKTFTVPTMQRVDIVDITSDVQSAVADSSVRKGIIVVYVPHTTCGVMINEHADPDVVRDIKMQFEKLVPYQAGYRHLEGNSDSHIKTAMVGSSETIIIENGRLVLGTWQGVFLCDFDGPRTRKVHLKILSR